MGDKFRWAKDDLHISQCVDCKHKQEAATCAAFPDGIPEQILLNEHDHRKPYKGDHGIQFEPIRGKA